MRELTAGACLLFAACAVWSQSITQRPEFETESVTPSRSGLAEHVEQFNGSQFTVRNLTVAQLLPFAFLRRENAIVGIPDWFRTDRYDVIAKAPTGANEPTLALMMQSLLSREFGFVSHEEQRTMDAFALTAGKDESKLKNAPGPGYPGCVRDGSAERLTVDCTSITIRNLMSYLSTIAPDYIDRPVVDQTGLHGTFELSLSWTPKRAMGGSGTITIFDALSKQLGLSLIRQELPVQVVVIDDAKRPQVGVIDDLKRPMEAQH